MRRFTVGLGISALTVASIAAADSPQPWPVFAVEAKVGVKVGDTRLHDVVSVEGNLFTTSVLTFREGSDAGGVRKIAGPSTPGEIIVRRAVRTDDVLWSWYQQVLAGDTQRKDVIVIYQGGNGSAAVRFDLVRCFPSAYALHAGVGQATTTAVEAVTLSCEGASRSGQ
jgi:phage tail-like protein